MVSPELKDGLDTVGVSMLLDESLGFFEQGFSEIEFESLGVGERL